MNESRVKITQAKYSIGELVHHQLFDYRGVIVDIDPNFQLSDEWYDMVARSRPPKYEPWYHVLVDDATEATYVAERNLETDSSSEEINHPLTDRYFAEFRNGKYVNDRKIN